MNVASFADTVFVLPGLYGEQIPVDMHDPDGMNRAAVIMRDGVALIAYAGADSTTIEGCGTEAAVYFDSCGPQTLLRGFTIIGACTGWGLRQSVLCWSSSPVIDRNVMRPPYSGVYAIYYSSPTVSGNAIERHVWLAYGSGGCVVGNTIDGTVGIDCLSVPCAPLLIQDNVIYSSRGRYEDSGVHVPYGTSGDVLVVNNTIRDKEVGALLCFGQLAGNRFLNNLVNVKLERYCDPRSDVLAEMNWWGTTVPEEIEAKIVDCVDDPELPGCVDYEPWCMDEACTQSPVQTLTWSSIKRMYVPRE